MARAVLATVLCLALACCVTGGKGDDVLAVMQVAAQWKTGLETGDIDRMMACYSERYVDYPRGPKDRVREFYSKVMETNYLKHLSISLDRAEVTFEDGRAIVWPIDWRGAGPDHSIEFTFEKEDGAWRIVEMDGL